MIKVDAQYHKGTSFPLRRGHFHVWVKYKIIAFTAFTDCNIINYANYVLSSYSKMTSERLEHCDFSALTFMTKCTSKKFQMEKISSNNDHDNYNSY